MQQEQQSTVEIWAVADQASAYVAETRQRAELQAEADALIAQLLAEQQHRTAGSSKS